MTAWGLIPTCDNAMSIYTLLTFIGYSVVLVLGGRIAVQRLDHQEEETADIADSVNGLKICMAVMRESLKNIESDSQGTRMAIAEINRTLLNKLT